MRKAEGAFEKFLAGDPLRRNIAGKAKKDQRASKQFDVGPRG